FERDLEVCAGRDPALAADATIAYVGPEQGVHPQRTLPSEGRAALVALQDGAERGPGAHDADLRFGVIPGGAALPFPAETPPDARARGAHLSGLFRVVPEGRLEGVA